MSAATLTPPPVRPAAGHAAQPRLWTAAEFNHLGELGWFEGRRAYLIDGVILEQGPMNELHAVGIALAHAALQAVFAAGWCVRVQSPLVVGESTNPMPDLAIVPGGPRDYLSRHPDTAALVVEVSDSTLFDDLTVKAEKYARAGIADYWVLDVAARRLLVFRDPATVAANGNSYRTHLTLGPTESVAPLAAPNSPVNVADLLP